MVIKNRVVNNFDSVLEAIEIWEKLGVMRIRNVGLAAEAKINEGKSMAASFKQTCGSEGFT